MKKIFFIILPLIIGMSAKAQTKDSIGFYISAGYGVNNPVSNYASSDNTQDITHNPWHKGYASNGGMAVAGLGVEFSKIHLRAEISGAYITNEFNTRAFLALRIPYYFNGYGITSDNYDEYHNLTLMGGLTYSYNFWRFSFDMKWAGGIIYWTVPAISANFLITQGNVYNCSININSAAVILPCISAGAGLRGRIWNGLSAVFNIYYFIPAHIERFYLSYTTTGMPTYQPGGFGNNGSFAYAPGVAQSFSYIFGVEYILVPKHKK